MDVLRTPDERFENLKGYPFAPHYTEVPDSAGGKLRIHHVDEGPRDGEPILLLHGQPTWSYLYRKMIPILAGAGHRVLAPDFVGFGRSDKPTRVDDYSYARHVAWMSAWLETLDLRGVTLFCQDWGGLIGLRLVAAHPERFARVVAANTALPDMRLPEAVATGMRELYTTLPVIETGELLELFTKGGPSAFLSWQKLCAESPDLQIGGLIAAASGGALDPAVAAGYDAPFPDDRYKAGPRKFPSLVPLFPDDPAIPDHEAAWTVLATFDKPFLTAFSDGDPVTRGGEKAFQERVAGAKGVAHVTIHGAGHFLQEDKGEEVAQAILDFVRAHPAA